MVATCLMRILRKPNGPELTGGGRTRYYCTQRLRKLRPHVRCSAELGGDGPNRGGAEGRIRTSRRSLLAQESVLANYAALAWRRGPPTGLRRNAAPNHTLLHNMPGFVISPPNATNNTAEKIPTPPSETATDAATDTFTAKLVVNLGLEVVCADEEPEICRTTERW